MEHKVAVRSLYSHPWTLAAMFGALFERIRNFLYRLNLFDDDPTVDGTVVEKQRFATRIYLSFMCTLLLLIGIVTLTMERSLTGYVSSPTEPAFRHLSSAYSSTLQCPCRDIAILYQSFAHIHPQFHQVCSSAFVTDEWIRSISTDLEHLEMSFFWQIIAGFCRLSQTAVNATIDQFHVTALISTIAVAEDPLRIETRAAFDAVLSSSRSLFFRNLIAIQRATAGNQFVSALATNFDAQLILVDQQLQPNFFSRISGNCSCLNLEGCPRSSVEGLVSDCLMINAALQSSLQCYFNQTCLSHLHPALASSINRLNPDNNHQSNVNSTIEDLLNRFLLDGLSIEVDFAVYYQNCQPYYCSYNYRRRFDYEYAVTTIIGIFSGLNVVLRLLCPRIAKTFSSRRVVPTKEPASRSQSKETMNFE